MPIALAKMSSARLRVINVIDASVAIYPYTNPGITIPFDPSVILKGYQETSERNVAEIVQLGKNAGIKDVSGDVVIGSPRQTLVEWSKEQGADMIVVGSHGSSRLTYLSNRQRGGTPGAPCPLPCFGCQEMRTHGMPHP